ncbi:fatty acid desaturase-domain-containing protein [Apiospora saccharicola]|uniref:Delta 8-(E)-sphingolipid desaturase n=1 Tax=Apiospora saccharicola TaxID=335842 RepID=A0ABR1U2E9_9PEZI
MMDTKGTVSPAQVEHLISQGHIIVIYEGQALKLDKWLDKHPGGGLAILHMVGRDAGDEIKAYHTDKTLKTMKAFSIGPVDLPWVNMIPPIQADVPALPGQKAETTCTEKSEKKAASGPCKLTSNGRKSVSPSPGAIEEQLTKEGYTAAMEERERQDDIRNLPSMDMEQQAELREKYQALHQRVKDEGLYDCPYIEYGKECARYAALFGTFLYLASIGWYLTSALFLGGFWQQIMFSAHDAGHRGITGSVAKDTLIGTLIADFCCGLSFGWWKSSHNVHHLITNMPEHDPDTQYLPLFAWSPTFFRGVRSTYYDFDFVWDKVCEVAIPFQKYTYYPIMAVARFNLYFLSWGHVILGSAKKASGAPRWARQLEVVGMAVYWFLFGYCLVWRTLPDWPTRIAFVLLSHAVTMLIHVQITLSHWGMSTADLGPTESFVSRQLRTTMDVDCPEWLDFLHGGLQFQAVHHLFPRVPRHNLRKGQVLLREFCEDTKLEYHCYGFAEGNGIILSRLEEVGKMVETLVKCQTHLVQEYTEGAPISLH